MSVQVTQTWLHSQWHIQVPHAWLDACVNWIKEEADNESVPQSLLNQRVLEQWLLTDLRDLSHPVLPERISEAQKTELNSCYCLQMDSLLDVSQPAYTQLQNIRGTDCSNDQVSAVTPETQRPWEAKPTRMLMLQLTDGVQSLEGMEYRPIPTLSSNLPPGTKLQLVGPIMVRLGVLLLKAENVKVLGGEVEQLLEIYTQRRVLCGTLGLPEENHPQAEEPDDQDLLEAVIDNQVADSGYASLTSEASFRPPQHQLQPCPQATPNAPEDDWVMDEIPDDDFRSIPDNFDDVPQNVVDDVPEDFDDIPLEELDSVMGPIDSEVMPGRQEPDAIQPNIEEPSLVSFRSRTTLYSRNLNEVPDASVASSSTNTVEEPDANLPNQPKTEEPSQTFRSRNLLGNTHQHEVPQTSVTSSSANTAGSSSCERDAPTPPYLCMLQAGRWPPAKVQVFRLQAFIVTLIGNLRSSTGVWKLGATISDGTGYLDVDLSDTMLTKLIGCKATEVHVLRKDPARRGEVDRGIQHCQRELVDMCCMMSVQVDQTGRGVLLSASPLSDRECSEIQERVKARRN